MSAPAAAERLSEDTLFLACTRPAMVLGAPMEAIGVNVIVSTIAFLAGGSPLYLLAAPPVHLVCRAVCKSDPNAFRVLYLFIETKGRARHTGLWGGSSLNPLPVRRRGRRWSLAHG